MGWRNWQEKEKNIEIRWEIGRKGENGSKKNKRKIVEIRWDNLKV